MTMDRRSFLRGCAAAAAGGAALAAGGTAEARSNKPMPPEAVGLLYDGTLCIGCKACMYACKQANDMPPEFTELETEAGVNNFWDAPLDISGKTLNVIKAFRDGSGENKDQEKDGYAFTKLSCYHCVDPSCVSACPVSAMTKDPANGIVSYSKDACIGCRYCVAACPFGVPRFTYESPFPKISKCQLCRHRAPDGKYAACAEVCPTGATLFGPVARLKEEIARRMAAAPGSEYEFPRGKVGSGDSFVGTIKPYVKHVFGEEEIGGTQVLHLSAVPFEKLGKPVLPDVAPASVSETLQHRLYHGLIAPIAFLGVLVFAAKRNMKNHED